MIDIIKELEKSGAENINLVTASHYLPNLIEVFKRYRPQIPVVYNTHSYENLQTLKELDRYIDIYLPDLKFYNGNIAKRYTGKADYFEHAQHVVAFMMQRKNHFQNGKMLRGCIVRHLILPLCTQDSIRLIDWFAMQKSQAYLSVMAQYTPFGEIENFTELQRPITQREHQKVLDHILQLKLDNIYLQELAAANKQFIPNFTQSKKELF